MFGDLPPSSSVIFFSVSAAPRMMPLPVDGVAGERDLVDAGMLDDRLADAATPGPVMTLSTPGGRPTSMRDLAERERGQRRLARRLEDDGVAARQRRRDLPRRQQQRKIPRHDRRDDADRLAQRVGEVVALDRDRLAVNLVGPAGEVLEALGGGRDLDLARFENRLAVVQRLEPRDLVGALHQPLAELPDQPAALARRHLAPRPVERRARRGDRRVDVGLLGRRDRRRSPLRSPG